MSTINCDACNELREYAPEFVQNGVTTNVATSLSNNTGFNPSLTVTHKDCEDLNDANDCLVGRMDQEIEAYEVCDWKKYMHKLVPNVYELLKAMIASICGLWIRVECLVEALYNQDYFKPIVTHPRSQGSGDASFFEPATDFQTINLYMDSVSGNDGSVVADKNYTCIISICCNNIRMEDDFNLFEIICHTSSQPYNEEIRNKWGMHVSVGLNSMRNVAIPVTAACPVKKGDHLVVNLIGDGRNTGDVRLHQFVITWIPDFQIEPCVV